MDLFVKARSSDDRERLIVTKRLIELGWDGVAWNYTICGKPTQHNINNAAALLVVNSPRNKKLFDKKQILQSSNDVSESSNSKKVPSEHQNIPLNATDLNLALRSRMLLSTESRKSSIANVPPKIENWLQLSRITIVLDDIADAQAITSSNELLRPFDIIAATPGNAKILSHLCHEAEVDVISIDFSRSLPFSINKKVIDVAVKRGIFFEIRYSPCLSNPISRKEVFNGTKQLIRVLRGRNIILSSGADTSPQLRGPFDALNIGVMLQLTKQQSFDAVFENYKKVVSKGKLRKNRNKSVQIVSYQQLLDRLNSNVDNSPAKSKISSNSRKRGRSISSESSDSSDDEGKDSDEDNSIKSSEQMHMNKSNSKRRLNGSEAEEFLKL